MNKKFLFEKIEKMEKVSLDIYRDEELLGGIYPWEIEG